MKKFKISLFVICLIFIFSNNLFCFSPSVIDDLFKIASKITKFKHINKTKFTEYLMRANIDDIVPLIKKLPSEKRVETLLEIASKKKLIKTTEVYKYYHQGANMKNYDNVLINIIKKKPKKLSPGFFPCMNECTPRLVRGGVSMDVAAMICAAQCK